MARYPMLRSRLFLNDIHGPSTYTRITGGDMNELLTKIADTLDSVRIALEALNTRVTALEHKHSLGIPTLYVSLPEQDRSSHVDVGARVDSSHSGN